MNWGEVSGGCAAVVMAAGVGAGVEGDVVSGE